MKVEVKIDETCEETIVIIRTNRMSDEVDALVRKLSEKQLDLLAGFRDGAAAVIESKNILRVYASNQKVYIVTEEGEYTARLRLYQMEERLPPREFVRISNAEIVNLKKVKDFDLSFSGMICVRFLNGDTTYVSRRYVSRIKSILGM